MNDPKQNTHIPAETALIGSLLIDNSVFDEISYLRPEDFGVDLHSDVYRAICNLINEGKTADTISVSEYLSPKDDSLFVEVCDIANSVFTASNIKQYADIVKEYSLDRKMISVAQGIISSVREKKDNRLDSAQQKINEIADVLPFSAILAKDVLASVIQKIDERQNKTSEMTEVSTGFFDIDKIIRGFNKGHLIVLAARPSMGKTLLAMNFAEHAAINKGKTVIVFSLEMNKEELIERSLSSLGNIEAELIKSGKLKTSDFEKLSSVVPKYAGANLFIEDSASLTVSDIRSRCRRIKRENGLDLVVVDYLGLISGDGENDTDRVSKISRSLKLLARDLNVPVVVVSQLNRGVEQRQDKRPTMADLRQSGAIEQDADLILFIYRDEVYNKESSNKGIAEINIAKNRHGSLGTAYLAFNNNQCRFDNYFGSPISQIRKPISKNHFYDKCKAS